VVIHVRKYPASNGRKSGKQVAGPCHYLGQHEKTRHPYLQHGLARIQRGKEESYKKGESTVSNLSPTGRRG